MSEVVAFESSETPTFQVRILDANGDPVAPISGAVGRFGIYPPDGATIIQRDSVSSPALVWFAQSAPFWYLFATLLETDTPTPGLYGFEFRLDQPALGLKNTVQSFWMANQSHWLAGIVERFDQSDGIGAFREVPHGAVPAHIEYCIVIFRFHVGKPDRLGKRLLRRLV